jgi:comEA protein
MWKRIIGIAHRFGFTRNEAAVILFLSFVIVGGSVISELRSAPDRQGKVDVRRMYREADTTFANRAGLPPSSAESPTELQDHSSPQTTETAALVNLNTATEKDLTLLSGIGPATAKKIIAFRKEHGPFGSIEQITQVKGIGPKKFEQLRDFITVE